MGKYEISIGDKFVVEVSLQMTLCYEFQHDLRKIIIFSAF